MFVKNGTGELKRVLVSPPTYLKPAPINEIAKKWKDSILDIDKMQDEYQLFVDTYQKNGVKVETLQPNEQRPNSVFARDFGGCIQEGYILGNFKYKLREKERIDYEYKMKELHIPKIATVTKGCFEGGDFMFIDERHILIGMADRTNHAGFLELKEQLEPYGYHVIPAELPQEYLHLDMCFNLVDDKLAVAYEKGMPDTVKKLCKELEIEIIPVEEESIFLHGCNLQALGKKRVFSLARNKQLNEQLDQKGMHVIELEIEEILKAGGGPHCMTFPLERR